MPDLVADAAQSVHMPDPVAFGDAVSFTNEQSLMLLPKNIVGCLTNAVDVVGYLLTLDVTIGVTAVVIEVLLHSDLNLLIASLLFQKL